MDHPKRRLILALGASVLVVLALVGVAAAATLPSTPASSHAAHAAVDAAQGVNQHAQDVLDQHASGPTTEQGTEQTGETQSSDTSSNDHGSTVAAAAQSDLVGGAHQNHGGYVSCVARGGTDCTSSSPTLPQHGGTLTLPQAALANKH